MSWGELFSISCAMLSLFDNACAAHLVPAWGAQNPVPNAYTLAIAGRKPFVVVHTALLELLTPAEVQAVIAHELGHLRCDHGVWLTAANVLASGTVSVSALPLCATWKHVSWCRSCLLAPHPLQVLLVRVLPPSALVRPQLLDEAGRVAHCWHGN